MLRFHCKCFFVSFWLVLKTFLSNETYANEEYVSVYLLEIIKIFKERLRHTYTCSYHLFSGADPGPPGRQPRRDPQTSHFTLQHRDVLTMFASVSGGVAYRNFMIPMFAEELRQSSDREGDIYEVFLRTHNRLKKEVPAEQILEIRSTLSQKLCLTNIFMH